MVFRKEPTKLLLGVKTNPKLTHNWSIDIGLSSACCFCPPIRGEVNLNAQRPILAPNRLGLMVQPILWCSEKDQQSYSSESRQIGKLLIIGPLILGYHLLVNHCITPNCITPICMNYHCMNSILFSHLIGWVWIGWTCNNELYWVRCMQLFCKQ